MTKKQQLGMLIGAIIAVNYMQISHFSFHAAQAYTIEFALWPRSLHLHRSKSLSVSVGQIRSLSHVSAAAQQEGTSSLAGERVQLAVLQLYQGVMMCNSCSRCDDISGFQDVENDDWQGSFPDRKCIEFWSAVPWGFLR